MTSGQKYKTRLPLLFIVLVILTVFCFFADIIFGSVHIPFSETWKAFFTDSSSLTPDQVIIVDFRLPRALAAIFSGMALAVSGLLMQTIFRNPLAGPYVLGISSGASLGVAIAVMSGAALFGMDITFISGNWAIVIAAFIGAFLVMFLIMAVSVRIRNIMTILILGIMFSAASAAIVNILQYFSPEAALKSFVIWTMGSLSSITSGQLTVMIPVILAGLVLSFFVAGPLNAILPGDSYAKSAGVNMRLTRFIVFVSTSVLAGAVTAFCGPIGFVGLAVPHIARLIFRTSGHFILIPACLLIGALMMLVSDMLSQLSFSMMTLPINAVTSLLGIPVVVLIILRGRQFREN
jgi:iron complex transport system permease protein